MLGWGKVKKTLATQCNTMQPLKRMMVPNLEKFILCMKKAPNRLQSHRYI